MTPTYTPGKFVWRELFTKDVEGAKRFYAAMFGWNAVERPMGPDWSYTLWMLGDKQVGGMMDIGDLPPELGTIPPHWAVSVSVPDVDAAVRAAEAEGGRALSPCKDIPQVGRFAVVQDPEGAVLNVFHSANGDPADTRPQDHEFCWENLSSTDPARVLGFYQKVVGWSAAPMGDATVFSRQAGDETVGVASVGQAPEGSRSYWAPFVGVKAIAPYLAKCQDLGGKVLVDRTPIPDVGAFAVVEDPTGATFFLFEAQ
jgi:hypothetical protein